MDLEVDIEFGFDFVYEEGWDDDEDLLEKVAKSFILLGRNMKPSEFKEFLDAEDQLFVKIFLDCGFDVLSNNSDYLVASYDDGNPDMYNLLVQYIKPRNENIRNENISNKKFYGFRLKNSNRLCGIAPSDNCESVLLPCDDKCGPHDIWLTSNLKVAKDILGGKYSSLMILPHLENNIEIVEVDVSISVK